MLPVGTFRNLESDDFWVLCVCAPNFGASRCVGFVQGQAWGLCVPNHTVAALDTLERRWSAMRGYVTFWPNFHHFHRFELDLRGHTRARGAAFSCLRLKLADIVLI